MRTMARTGVAALVLAMVIAGCGRGDGTEEVAVVRDLDLMEGVDAAGSARMAFRLDSSLPTDDEGEGPAVEMRMTMEGEGEVAFATGEARWAATWAVEVVPPEGSVDEHVVAPPTNLEVIESDAGGWSRSWAEGEDPPGWDPDGGSSDGGDVHEEEADDDEADDDEVDGDLLDPTRLDPTAFLDRLREEAGTVTVVGEEEVRGDAATRYRAEVDSDLLGEDLGGQEADEVTIDVWVDGDDRLRQVEAAGMTLELWDFGVPVDVSPPTDLADPDEPGFLEGSLPEVTGDWEAAATGTTGGTGWTVFAAPGELYDRATTCRTLELAGAPADGPGLDEWGAVPLPMHGSALATCGNGLAATAISGFVPEPALQLLSSEVVPVVDQGGTSLVAFVVAPEHATDGVSIVREGAEPVVLELDASGIAVWDAADSAPITAVELDGGAVRCTFGSGADEGGGGTWAEDPASWFGFIPPVCVAA